MTIAANSAEMIADGPKIRDEWVQRLATLIDEVQEWATELGWATRRLETRLDESEIGTYVAPMLLMQEGPVRVQLEPIARFVPGADGVADLYRMPAYDDIATLTLRDGQWQINSWSNEIQSDGEILELQPLSKDSFGRLLARLKNHAQQA